MASSRDDGFSRLCGDDDGDDKHGSALLLGGTSPSRSSSRVIPAGPSKILDAPDLMDDYYLNLLSWGKNNVLAVALRNTVYLWHAADGAIETLFACTNDDYVCSLQWCGDASLLAVGTSSGAVEVWDTNVKMRVRLLSGGHTARISALAWQGQSQHCLSTGGRDTTVLNHDLRIPGTGEVTSKFLAHIQEVCGLAWSECGATLASGGNENRLCLWDSVGGRGGSYRAPDGSHQPRFIIEQHLAAVKALAWCPWSRHTLASGGGTADRTIRIWNASSGSMLRSTDTGSQVCALQWSNTEKELVSSHGFSDNQLILWKYPTLTRIKEFRGHTARVLHLAKSPDGRTICSASADETIRFWDLFDPKVVSAGGGFGSPKGKGPGFSPKALLGGAMGDIR
jgi:cell division cycle protein 20 (cofactor of APC complex)